MSKTGEGLLVIYSLVFIVLLNLVVFLLDAAHLIPVYLMQALRYVLVATVSYTVVVAAILQKLGGLLRSAGKLGLALQRVLPLLLAAGLLASMATTWSHWLLEKSHMESALRRLAALAGQLHLPIVCEDHESAFFLTQRAGATDVRYVLAEEFPFKTLMRRVHEYYPQPAPISPTDRHQTTNDFVLLPAGQAPVVIPAQK